MPRIDAHSFYADCLAQYGETAQGLHFQCAQTQEARFRVLRQCLPDDLSSLAIVDLGCGFGDLHGYLAASGGLPARYVGIDVHERMVATARERTGAEILHRDALQDPLPVADFYVCSGAMNTLTRDETQSLIGRCYDVSRRGFVFNLLQGRDWSETFNYRDPEEVEEWASQLGAAIEIVDGYLHQDFTVALSRPGQD